MEEKYKNEHWRIKSTKSHKQNLQNLRKNIENKNPKQNLSTKYVGMRKLIKRHISYYTLSLTKKYMISLD